MGKYKCWKCGGEIMLSSDPKERKYCNRCGLEAKMSLEDMQRRHHKLGNLLMIERAVKIMENSGKCFMYDYKEYIDEMHEIVELGEKFPFDSSHEIVAALILSDWSYGFKKDFRVNNYRIDFWIPELKVCLEIDGDRHKANADYDSGRDIDIRNALGSEWEIVRIPIKYVEENPIGIVDAIEKMPEEFRKARRKNGGVLPYGFSKRQNAIYKKYG